MIYEYKQPGIELPLSKEQVNLLTASWSHSNKPSWKLSFKYFQKDNDIVVEKYTPLYLVVFALLAYPLSLLYSGFSNFKELNKEYYGLLNQKKTGSFSRDLIQNGMDKIK